MGRSRARTRLLSPEPAEVGRPFAAVPPTEPAQEPGDTAVDEAVARGYQDGLDRAQQALAAEVEAFREEARESLKRIADYEASFAADHESAMLELVLATASRVVRRRIEDDDPVAARAFAEALETLPDSTTVRARVHTDDLPSILDANREAVDAGRLELVPDESLARGGVILETDLGKVDATLETAERAVRDAAFDTRGTQ